MEAFLETYYYIFCIPMLSISVFYGLQYMTRGTDYFVFTDTNKIKWRFLGFLACAQYFISLLITWGVLSAFSSEYLQDYETLKLTSMIVLGGSPFNITILVWVALKLEIYKLMRQRYGDSFSEDDFFIRDKKRTDDEDSKNESFSMKTNTTINESSNVGSKNIHENLANLDSFVQKDPKNNESMLNSYENLESKQGNQSIDNDIVKKGGN